VHARFERAHPHVVGGGQRRREIAQRAAELAHHDGQGQPVRVARLGQRFQRAHAAQEREHAVGDERAIARAELAMLAEKGRQAGIGSGGEAAYVRDRLAERRELAGAQRH
jgi:hypothetical protein